MGLAFCHGHRIIHRDLKPHNILLSNDITRVKIADFGLARSCLIPGKTLTHEVVTLWYRAPELLLGDCNYNTNVDMWSVGCIVAELLSRTPLFAGDCEIDTLFRICRLLGTPVKQFWPKNAVVPWEDFPKLSGKDNPIMRLSEELDKTGQHFLSSLLQFSSEYRITALQALNHPWLKEVRDEKKLSSSMLYPEYLEWQQESHFLRRESLGIQHEDTEKSRTHGVKRGSVGGSGHVDPVLLTTSQVPDAHAPSQQRLVDAHCVVDPSAYYHPQGKESMGTVTLKFASLTQAPDLPRLLSSYINSTDDVRHATNTDSGVPPKSSQVEWLPAVSATEYSTIARESSLASTYVYSEDHPGAVCQCTSCEVLVPPPTLLQSAHSFDKNRVCSCTNSQDGVSEKPPHCTNRSNHINSYSQIAVNPCESQAMPPHLPTCTADDMNAQKNVSLDHPEAVSCVAQYCLSTACHDVHYVNQPPPFGRLTNDTCQRPGCSSQQVLCAEKHQQAPPRTTSAPHAGEQQSIDSFQQLPFKNSVQADVQGPHVEGYLAPQDSCLLEEQQRAFVDEHGGSGGGPIAMGIPIKKCSPDAVLHHNWVVVRPPSIESFHNVPRLPPPRRPLLNCLSQKNLDSCRVSDTGNDAAQLLNLCSETQPCEQNFLSASQQRASAQRFHASREQTYDVKMITRKYTRPRNGSPRDFALPVTCRPSSATRSVNCNVNLASIGSASQQQQQQQHACSHVRCHRSESNSTLDTASWKISDGAQSSRKHFLPSAEPVECPAVRHYYQWGSKHGSDASTTCDKCCKHNALQPGVAPPHMATYGAPLLPCAHIPPTQHQSQPSVQLPNHHPAKHRTSHDPVTTRGISALAVEEKEASLSSIRNECWMPKLSCTKSYTKY